MRPTLAAKILILVAGSVVGLAVADAVVVSIIGQQQIRSLVRSDVQSTGALLARILTERGTAMAGQAHILARLPVLKACIQAKDEPTLQDMATDFAAQMGASRVVLCDRDGKAVADSAANAPEQAVSANRLGIDTALDGNDWTGIVATHAGLSLAVTAPIKIGPAVWGTLSAFRPIDSRLATDLTATLAGNHVIFFDGVRQVGSSNPAIRMGAHELKSPEIVQSGREKYFSLYASFPFSRAEDHVGFAVLRPYQQAMMVYARLRNLFLGISGGVLLLVLIAGVVLSQGITQSLNSVVRAAEIVKSGKWPTPFPHYANDEIGLLQSVFDEMTVAVHSADEKVRHGSLATIQALAAAVDAKDTYTKGHSARVAEYAARLAERMGLDEDRVTLIHITGTLHDVGKIGVPDAILSKPGKLTDEERGIMETHPVVGEQIVKNAPQLASSLPGIRHHHERWDGKGYPDRIAGEAIPLDARILALADTFDAMTSDRPYRNGMPIDKALCIIAEESGAQFDPALAPVFVEMIKETVRSVITV